MRYSDTPCHQINNSHSSAPPPRARATPPPDRSEFPDAGNAECGVHAASTVHQRAHSVSWSHRPSAPQPLAHPSNSLGLADELALLPESHAVRRRPSPRRRRRARPAAARHPAASHPAGHAHLRKRRGARGAVRIVGHLWVAQRSAEAAGARRRSEARELFRELCAAARRVLRLEREAKALLVLESGAVPAGKAGRDV